VEQAPAIEGRAMSMMLVPVKGAKKKTKDGSDEPSVKSETPQEQSPAQFIVKE
jgi:hypothetical protein